jgi:hypothetical protein
MRRAARFLVTLGSVAALVGCGVAPNGPAPTPAPPAALPPAAAVGANGQPISSMCDLLSDQDFNQIGGGSAAPAQPKTSSGTAATCDYGTNLQFTVQVGGSIDEARTNYQAAVQPLTSVKDHPIGGVDESAYGISGGKGVMVVHRLKLVITIAVPSAPDAEVKLVQLAARVLERAHALGT